MAKKSPQVAVADPPEPASAAPPMPPKPPQNTAIAAPADDPPEPPLPATEPPQRLNAQESIIVERGGTWKQDRETPDLLAETQAPPPATGSETVRPALTEVQPLPPKEQDAAKIVDDWSKRIISDETVSPRKVGPDSNPPRVGAPDRQLPSLAIVGGKLAQVMERITPAAEPKAVYKIQRKDGDGYWHDDGTAEEWEVSWLTG
jgi:hypothetical protein